MAERRRAPRYEVCLPLQVCTSGNHPAEFSVGQLRDISRAGIYFHTTMPIGLGSDMMLTFALPTDRERGAAVLIRASAKALRVSPLAEGVLPTYGVAATIDRIDFVRPVMSNLAHAAA